MALTACSTMHRFPHHSADEKPHADLVDMQVIVRRQDQLLCASITCMIRHYVARRAKVIFDHPHNADERTFAAPRRRQLAYDQAWAPFDERFAFKPIADRL